MWIHRNSITHSEESAQNIQLSAQINDGIKEQFSLGIQDLPAHVRPLLKDGLKKVLRQNLLDRQDWLQLVRLERRHASRAAKRQRKRLRRFLTPT